MKKKIFTLLLALVAATGFSWAQTVDENGIITAPAEGVSKYYARSGTGFYVSNNTAYSEAQSGHIEIVECNNGDVYFKDMISHYSQNSWVKGTKSDNTITVSVGQPVAYNSQYGTTLSICWGNYTGSNYAKNDDKNEITFTVDEAAGTITLEESSQNDFIGVIWDDDNSWSGYGDYGTVWTYDASYEPASLVPVTLPDGAEIEQWYAFGSDNGESANVAWVGNDVYISGIFASFPDAWIKGTLGDDGSTVTFPKFQYLGEYSSNHIWAVAANQDSELLDIIMHYENNEDGRKLTLDADQTLFLNAAEDKVYYLQYFESLKLMENAPGPKQIDELPYLNTFDSEEEQADFKIIDANNDIKTWAAYSGMMRYTYSSTNTGDDWLVSPMIKLIAGKVYKISLNTRAQNSSYPEKLEVKAAKEATASGAETAALLAAGAEVIAATTITTVGFISLSNDTFTVAETGYYNFGIHAISDADKYYLYVDDFVVERIVTPDQEAAEAVEALFDALPVADAVTLDDKTAIEAARAAYEALTGEQKALVTAEELAKLTDAEAALAAAEKAAADQEAADAVVALFDALPADITLDNKEAIEAARAAYEALTDEQKALVTPEDLAILTDAEAALAAAEKAAADQVAAGAVVALFDALPAADAVTLNDKTAIEAARAAYEALTDEQKALVTAEELAKLTAAEAALAAAEKEGVENVQGDVKNVKTMVNGQIFILRGDKTYTVQGQEVK